MLFTRAGRSVVVTVVVVPSVDEVALLVEYVLFGVAFMLFIVPLVVELLFIELALDGVVLFVAFVLSVVTGDVYVGFAVVLVAEYVLVVVWAFAMPTP